MYYLKCYDSSNSLISIINSFIDLSWASSINATTQLNFTIPRTDTKTQYLKYGAKLELWQDNSLIQSFYLQTRDIEYDNYRYTALGPLNYLNRFRLPQEFDFSGWTQYDALSALLKEYKTYTLTWKSDWDSCTKSNVDTSSLTGENWYDSVILAKQTAGNYYSSGYIITQGIDLGLTIQSAYLRIQGSVGTNVGIRFKYRTSADNTNWSPWSSEVEYSSASKFHQISFSPQRYVQVQCTLWTNDTSAPDPNGNPVGYSPVLNAIQIVGVYNTIFSNTNIPNTLTKQLKNTSFDQNSNLEAIYNLCKQEKLEISDSFNPTVATQLGTDKSNSVLIHEGRDVTVFQLSDDFSECENYIYGYGAGDGIDRLVVIKQDDTSIASYGKRVGFYENGQCVDKTQLETETQAYLDEHKNPKQSFKVNIANWTGPSFDLGDTVRLKSPSFGIDGTFRVLEITRDIGGNISLTLSNTALNLIDFILLTETKTTLPPPKPIDLRLEILTSGKGIKLYYKKYSPQVEIFRSTDGTNYQSIGVTNENEFTDTNMNISTVNYYKVRGINIDGSASSLTDAVSALAPPSLNAWDGIVYSTFFDSIDGLLKTTAGTGTIELNTNGYYVRLSGSANGDKARLSHNPLLRVEDASWGKIRRMKTKIRLNFPTLNNFYIGTGSVEFLNYLQREHIGFRLDGSTRVLYGSAGNGTTETTVNLMTLDATTDLLYILEIISTPQAAYFYVNKNLVGTLSSGLPTGTTYATIFLNIVLWVTAATTRYIDLSEWHFVQEA